MPLNLTTHLWHIAAAIFALAGVVLLTRWLIGDRPRGRRRCPKCWYDMSATTSLTCSECGRTAKHERRMFRARRRRWQLLASCALLLVAVCLAAWPTFNSITWRRHIPTRILLRLTHDGPGTFVAYGVVRRAGHELPPARTLEQELSRRYFEADTAPGAHRTYARRDLPQPLTPDAVLTVRTPMQPGDAVRYCVSDPILSMTKPERCPIGHSRVLIVEPIDPPGQARMVDPALYLHARRQGLLPDLKLDNGALPQGRHSLRIRVRMEDVGPASQPPIVLLDTVIDRTVEITDAAPAPVERVDDPEVNARVADMFAVSIDPSSVSGPSIAQWSSISLLIDQHRFDDLGGIVHHVTVDLKRGDQTIAQAWVIPASSSRQLQPVRLDIPAMDVINELLDVEHVRRWTLSIKGTTDGVEACCNRIRVWTGIASVPVTVVTPPPPPTNPAP